MSNILIKGMEMPKNCWECSLSDIDDDFGRCCLYSGIACLTIGRQDNCPLVEIPTPHGRLGDLDALYAEISNGNKAYNGFDGYDGKYPNIANVDDCLDAIKYADTVIEAEGETDA